MTQGVSERRDQVEWTGLFATAAFAFACPVCGGGCEGSWIRCR